MEKDLCCQNTSRSWKPGRIPAFSVTSPAIAQSQAYLLQLKVIPFGSPFTSTPRPCPVSPPYVLNHWFSPYTCSCKMSQTVAVTSSGSKPAPLFFCDGVMHLYWARDEQFSAYMLASDILIQLPETGKNSQIPISPSEPDPKTSYTWR